MGHATKGIYNVTDTPVKKNKRKRSEPRKRTDFSIKRFCPDSPGGGSAGSESGRSEDLSPVNENSQKNERICDNSGRDSSQSHSSGSPGDSEISHNILPPQGMFLYPTHFPPSYMVPNLYKAHPAFLPNGAAPFQRMDIINNNNPKSVHNSDNSSSKNKTNSHTFEIPPPPPQDQYEDSMDPDDRDGKKTRKNYKNMTRERRVEANARERTRVHTISAAFENLRRAVPSYSYNQKLSKLAILRIASSYIMALGKLNDIQNIENEPEDINTNRNLSQNQESFGELVDLCTRTIQTEGRARRRH